MTHRTLIRVLWTLTAIVALAGTGVGSYVIADARSEQRGEARVHELIRGCERANVDRGLRLLEARAADDLARYALTLRVSPIVDCEATVHRNGGRSVPLDDQAIRSYLAVLNNGRVPVVRTGYVQPLPPGTLP